MFGGFVLGVVCGVFVLGFVVKLGFLSMMFGYVIKMVVMLLIFLLVMVGVFCVGKFCEWFGKVVLFSIVFFVLMIGLVVLFGLLFNFVF